MVTVKFGLPSTIATLMTATFLIVDGIFVAQYVGENALSAINVVFPLLSVTIAIAIMLPAGAVIL